MTESASAKLAKLIALEDLNYEQAHRSFGHYFRKSWQILEPGKPFLRNWHHDLIAEYLEACFLRQIKRLIINIPPRYTNSLLVTVAFPTWVWAHNPTERFLFASYAQNLSTFHSKKRRDVLESSWYQRRWGSVFQMSSDQNVKTEFANDKKGHMIATSMHGHATGKGGSFLVFDDPHDAEKAMSDVARTSDIEAFDQKFVTRLDDAESGVMIVVMQRLHEDDLTGHLLAQSGWEHVCLPAIAEDATRIIFPMSGKWYERKAGEVLHEARHDSAKLHALKVSMGTHKFVGQYQQSPSPQEGGIFKKQYWQRYNHVPKKFDEVLDSWDMSFKDINTADYVVGTVWGRIGAQCYLLHMTRQRMGLLESLRAVKHHRDRFPLLTKTLIEDKANGTGVIELIKKKITGVIPFDPGSKSKEERAYMVEHLLEARNVFVPVQEIATFDVELFIDECAKFPNGRHDDIVDSTTQALIKLDVGSRSSLAAMGWF
jgi:predicted phage terminase large subunit-like protein